MLSPMFIRFHRFRNDDQKVRYFCAGVVSDILFLCTSYQTELLHLHSLTYIPHYSSSPKT